MKATSTNTHNTSWKTTHNRRKERGGTIEKGGITSDKEKLQFELPPTTMQRRASEQFVPRHNIFSGRANSRFSN
ncbi:hypothetical protein CRE_26833 [Caenorhabditis remanei]|uniref:Uncharacterized protein n=1 Tax=Caenorhabditis remanei TaxID=31234 RepID=E3NKK6_CAERE|nr:hypothetical protein CRE_26833 [Caenorhabditis remanei]